MKRYLFYIEHDYCYGVLRPLQEAILRRGGETAWLPVGPDINAGYLRADERRLQNVAEAIDWNPFAVLVPGNEVPAFLPGLKIEVFHGLNSGKRRRRDNVEYHFIIRGLFDLYCTHGPNTTQRFQELAEKHGHFRVAETGWAKLDPLFDGSRPRPRNERPVVLFTSTFSPRLTAAPHLRETLQALAAKGEWKWIVNMHPKMAPDIVDSYRAMESDNFHFAKTDDVIPLLLEADVMLCDTSSILSEFLVQHKPVVTFRTARPADYVIDTQDPGDIEPALARALDRPRDLMKHIERYVEQTHPYRDGRSSERTLDAIDQLAEQGMKGLKRKPANRYRHWKMRRLLGYPWF